MRFGVLRERAFALLFSAQLISAAGDVIASVAVPFAILQLGGSARDIGLVLAARAIPLVLFLLIGGIITGLGVLGVLWLAAGAIVAGNPAEDMALITGDAASGTIRGIGVFETAEAAGVANSLSSFAAFTDSDSVEGLTDGAPTRVAMDLVHAYVKA